MKKHTEILPIEYKSQDAYYAENMRKVYARLFMEQRIWLDEEEKKHKVTSVSHTTDEPLDWD